MLLDEEKYYMIENVDQMDPFFISVVSSSNHWFFISSTGSLTAGRIRPENALFPYKSVDYIHESAENTGSKTIVRVTTETGTQIWEPFNAFHNDRYAVQRNLYKNAMGDKIVFEEINQDLGVAFTYQWCTSDKFGFVRNSNIKNISTANVQLELIDGIQNILPSGAPLGAMQDRSALVDAYKWCERKADSALATYSLYAKLSDRAAPAESLRATTVFSVGSECDSILLSGRQLDSFRRGKAIQSEELSRGIRGAYFVHKSCKLEAGEQSCWKIVADIDQTHSDIVALQQELDAKAIGTAVSRSIDENHEELLLLMSGSDAWQKTAEEETSVHHYANVLFNNMRGGIVVDNYWVESEDFVKTLTNANKAVAEKHAGFLADLPETIGYQKLENMIAELGDEQLSRLCYEYLPLTFGRRHGDPSRPWNHFEIKVKDDNGDRLLSYQGNWRDIFQNWEALALSYPNFISSFISKFVNASTLDGYNPYRITKEGIDWEILEPEDPWSNIGYWGDHQIIYLLKFLELSKKYQPAELEKLLGSDIFSYANVPYEIKTAEELFSDPKDTVDFNDEKQAVIEAKVAKLGSDGRLVLNADDSVYQVNLAEKLMVPLLAKLGNLVIDGGIWLNTQRPEWNDANNAIVGNGLSMVTLYYMRRYVAFMQDLFKGSESTQFSAELVDWLKATTEILTDAAAELGKQALTGEARFSFLSRLAKAASDYRIAVYKINGFSGKKEVSYGKISEFLVTTLSVIDGGIRANVREDGLYNAYNIIGYGAESAEVKELYPMLEGQVAALSSGMMTPEQAVKVMDCLYASEMFREDQLSFMLYPDRNLTRFCDKNQLDSARVQENALLSAMIEKGDYRLVQPDLNGVCHFNADFENAGYLAEAMAEVKAGYQDIDSSAFDDVLSLYEAIFNHQAFTGRSGTMFGYEGLGCIYWHMVSKLLLAVQENYFVSAEQNPDSETTKKLAEYYYKVREGIGFNKTPENYGAFPTDPYSHTPKHAGAQQPGMTGQVKEEVITRFGELGIIVEGGVLSIKPSLLKKAEFLAESANFDFVDLNGDKQSLAMPENSLGFTYCQVPFVYTISEEPEINVVLRNSEHFCSKELTLTAELSQQLFSRSYLIEKVSVSLPRTMLLEQ